MITGIETEYGILAHPAPGQPSLGPQEATLLLLGAREHGVPRAPGVADDFVLANGARYYLDHMHPEYCTAETCDPRAVVAADRAGECIVDTCRARLEQGPAGERVRLSLFKNNSDHKGNSYGCHENYLVSPRAWNAITADGGVGMAALVPFLVTRVLLAGAGKVGAENGTPPAGFQLSQRADFFEALYGHQTTHHRPLVNLRDEPHAPRDRYRRLHVIVGDANRADVSTFLKVGTTQLVLEMIEAGAVPPGYALHDPLQAFRQVSRDLSFRQPLALADGGERTAVEVQRGYLAAARAFVAPRAGDGPWTEVIDRWEATLAAIERDWTELAGTLDWAIKRALLETLLARHHSTWARAEAWQPVIEATVVLPDELLPARDGGTLPDPGPVVALLPGPVADRVLEGGFEWGEYWVQRALYFSLRRVDLEYHDVRREGDTPGLFARLESSGAVERLVSDDEVQALVERPPRDTRAWLRGRLVDVLGSRVTAADWSYLWIAGGAGEDLHVDLSDPARGHAGEADEWLESLAAEPALEDALATSGARDADSFPAGEPA